MSGSVAFRSIELVGVRKSAIVIPPETVLLTTTSGGSVEMKISNITVPNLITEDQNELIGYDAMKQDDTFAAIGVNAVVRLVSDDGKCLGVSGGGDAASSVLRWLSALPARRPLSESEINNQEMAAVGMILDNQRERERCAVLEMHSRGILDNVTRDAELALINKRHTGAYIRERDYFSGTVGTWRDSPQLILHQLKQKSKVAAKPARERRRS